MTLYQETELDEHRYLHDAVYHANRELVRGLVEAEVLVPVKPTYYQTSKGIDPEDVLIDWLTDHGVDKENAYNIAHPLVHSMLYSVGRAVKRAVVDAAVKEGKR